MAQTTKDGLTLIHNAKIYAFDEADYEWMLFDRHSGYIKAVGRKDPPISEPTPGDVIDLGWRRILPGNRDLYKIVMQIIVIIIAALSDYLVGGNLVYLIVFYKDCTNPIFTLDPMD